MWAARSLAAWRSADDRQGVHRQGLAPAAPAGPFSRHGQRRIERLRGDLRGMGEPVEARHDPARREHVRPQMAGRHPGRSHDDDVAGTGAGKGRSAIIPNLLTYPGSVYCQDFKGQNAAVTAQRRRDMGQAVYILEPMGGRRRAAQSARSRSIPKPGTMSSRSTPLSTRW